MLRLLMGRSGSGKSTWVVDRIREHIPAGRPLFLLVPEQASFAAERMLLDTLGIRDANRVQVVSFTRLAEVVFREVGGLVSPTGETLDDGVRALLMSRALEETAAFSADLGEVSPIRARLAGDAGYVEPFLKLWQEARQCKITTDQWEQVAAGKNSRLAEKADNLYRVFSADEGLVKAVGVEDLDTPDRLAERLPDCRCLDNAAVFVDGFVGFTAQEEAVLEGMLPHVAEMTVVLGSDTPGKDFSRELPYAREYPLFLPVTGTVSQLRRMGERHGMEWELTMLDENHRAQHPALKALEAGLYAPEPVKYEGDASCVTVVPCPDIYEECAYVARSVRRLMREDGLRCRDIAIVTRDLSAYNGILEDALEQEQVPYTLDGRRDLLTEPLIVYTRAALQVGVGGFRTEQVLRWLKTDLAPLSVTEIAELENYVYTWQIEGDAWKAPFTENPAGLDASFNAKTKSELAYLNTLREKVVAPLSALNEALRKDLTGREFAKAVYAFLTEGDALRERILSQIDRLNELGEPILAEHAARLWDELIDLLDRFAVGLGDQRMKPVRLEQLFTLLAQTVDIGRLPQGLDAVTVGQADHIRYTAPKAVFLLGMNEGVFPAYPESTGLLTEEERNALKDQGLTLADDALTRCIEERYHAYMAVAAPSHRLSVSYLTGGEHAPSPVVDMIFSILDPAVDTTCRKDGSDLESGKSIYDRLVSHPELPTEVTDALRAFVEQDKTLEGRWEAVRRGLEAPAARLKEPGLGEKLYGTELVLSASRTNRFFSCPFKHFCHDGLEIRPREIATVDAARFGTILHRVMEVTLPQYMQKGGLVEKLRQEEAAAGEETPEQTRAREQATFARLLPDIREKVRAVVEEYKRAHFRSALSPRIQYLLELAEQAGVLTVWRTLLELQQGAFDPVDFELAIHPEGAEAPERSLVSLRLPIPRGNIQLKGSIDRVDLFVREDGTYYVRIIDYKSSKQTLSPEIIAAGYNMQMLLYLFTVCDNFSLYKAAESLQPAGTLYQVIPKGKTEAPDPRSYRSQGFVLDDPRIVQAMEKNTAGRFVPVKYTKNGTPDRYSTTHTADAFERLRGVVRSLLTEMGTRLLEGDLQALPLQFDESKDPCEYCDYKAICLREEGAPTRPLPESDSDESKGEVKGHG